MIKLFKLFTVLVIVGGMMFGLTGCSSEEDNSEEIKKKTYNVNYDGAKEFYKNAKDSYKVGEKVILYYDMIATDTDYSFSVVGVDRKEVDIKYDREKGFIIEFTMPAHDVKVKCKAKNSMLPDSEKDTIIDYYTAVIATVDGDTYTKIVLNKTDISDKVRLYLCTNEDDGEVKTANYIVPYEVVDKCYDVIDKNKLDTWSDLKNYQSIDGSYKSCEFLKNGHYVEANTDYMPENGLKAFNEIEHILRSYIKDDYLV